MEGTKYAQPTHLLKKSNSNAARSTNKVKTSSNIVRMPNLRLEISKNTKEKNEKDARMNRRVTQSMAFRLAAGRSNVEVNPHSQGQS